MNNRINQSKTKRNSYVIIGDEEELDLIERGIKLKNLGTQTMSKLNKIVSCIQGIGCKIDESYGLDYDEILDILEEFYNYEIINKEDMVEPYNYSVIDINYNWEMYAQNDTYAEECNQFEVEDLRDRLKELIQKVVK